MLPLYEMKLKPSSTQIFLLCVISLIVMPAYCILRSFTRFTVVRLVQD